jgi:hypothetical protein
MMASELSTDFDREHDVLTISIGPKRSGRDEEERSGLVYRYDWTTGALIGVTLVDFEKYWRQRIPRIAEIIAGQLGLSKGDTEQLLKNIQH